MKNFILITGGARSGKSTFAEAKAKELGERIAYLATSIAFDEGMKDRIKKHKESRPQNWVTIEKYKDFNEMENNEEFLNADLILLDCITLLVSNQLLESKLDFEACSMLEVDEIEKNIFEQLEVLLEVLERNKKSLIAVTNEVGMGLVPSYRLGSIFRDIAGRVNQYLAQKSDEVYMTVSGIPIRIK